MKRFVLAAILALAFPAAAQAKDLTGLSLCGPSGCASAELTGFGHRPPFDPAGAGMAAPPPSSFFLLSFDVDAQDGAWPGIFYEPKSGLAAFRSGPAGSPTWNRLHPAVARLAKALARKVEPYPPPRIDEVRIGEHVLREGADSYLRLLELEGEHAVPGEGAALGIRFVSRVENPWTATSILYYPEDDIVQTTASTFMRLPSDLAADIEAARPLGAGERTVLPWLVLAALIAGLLLFAGLGALLRRPSLKRAVVTGAVLMLLAPVAASAKEPAQVCGGERCVTLTDHALTGPLHSSGPQRAAPSPAPFYVVRFTKSGWSYVYVPSAAAMRGDPDFGAGAERWMRAPSLIVPILADVTKRLEPYPASPTWTTGASAPEDGFPVGWVVAAAALGLLAAGAVVLSRSRRAARSTAARRTVAPTGPSG